MSSQHKWSVIKWMSNNVRTEQFVPNSLHLFLCVHHFVLEIPSQNLEDDRKYEQRLEDDEGTSPIQLLCNDAEWETSCDCADCRKQKRGALS